MKSDIQTFEDIKLLIDTFYHEVQRDSLIGEIFNKSIDDWAVHLEKMYRFWQTVLLEQHTYNGNPFRAHASLPISEAHFTNWLNLWYHTIDSLFEGSKAEEAKTRGDNMANMFISKLNYLRNSNRIPLI